MMVLHPFMMRFGGRKWAKKMMDGLLDLAHSSRHRKPFCIAMRNPAENLEAEKARLGMTQSLLAAGLPVFKTIERACCALYKFTEYYRLQEGVRS
jgi:hypothetical protein